MQQSSDNEVEGKDVHPNSELPGCKMVGAEVEKEAEKEVEIKVIDFEDALLFGDLVTDIHIYEYNPCYPLYGINRALQAAGMGGVGEGGECRVQVTAYYNDWFLYAITAWVRQDDIYEFRSFMHVYYEILLKGRKLEELVVRGFSY